MVSFWDQALATKTLQCQLRTRHKGTFTRTTKDPAGNGVSKVINTAMNTSNKAMKNYTGGGDKNQCMSYF